jgi:effector-binding domain-containing protein
MSTDANLIRQLTDKRANPMITTPQLVTMQPVPAAIVHLTIPRSRMQKEMPAAIHEAIDAAVAQNLGPVGPLYARHSRFDPETFDFEVGVPVSGAIQPTGRVTSGELPAVTVVQTIYRGPYGGLPEAWQAFEKWVRESEHRVGEQFVERYIRGPESTSDPADYETELSWEIIR